ncbi:MAG: ATP-binding protein [Clostridia bacterium]|nr:ATP-binding protein [Clostridia bacterium]
MSEKFNFNISLSVLNHLGRNLYRNVITVIGEAISNSWDADAKNVWINIDREHNSMGILDDGVGMDPNDFQNKFLKIGYTKRKNNNYKSATGRPFIGRKGIGKLALLSCAQRIHIASKTDNTKVIGGIIDNSGLDKAITDDLNSQEYKLDDLESTFDSEMSKIDHGTYILFDQVNNGIFNTVEYIKKAIALYFRFSLLDKDFNIFVNDTLIDESVLSDFSDSTQFLWTINKLNDPFIVTMKKLQEAVDIESKLNIRGYIATVEKPSLLKIRGTQEKATIDLFVNGRLRERDILRHIPTSRIVENYVYGQIHFDDLDQGGNKDIFTSSREGIISDDPAFELFLKEIDRIFREIIDQWDDFRRKHGNSGDPDNMKITPKARKAQEMFNTTLRDMGSETPFVKKGGIVEEWANKLCDEAQFNIPSYTECFISENLLREYIKHISLPLSQEAQKEVEIWKKKENENKNAANISYDIRISNNDLYYLDMKNLANLIDKVQDKLKDAGLSRSAVIYKPIRDAVGHTSIVTPLAKSQLTIEYENIKARLSKLLKDIDENNKE